MQNVEAKVGRKGSIKIRGDLPIAASSRKQDSDKARSGQKNSINMEAHALELRLRNSYTGVSVIDCSAGILQKSRPYPMILMPFVAEMTVVSAQAICIQTGLCLTGKEVVAVLQVTWMHL